MSVVRTIEGESILAAVNAANASASAVDPTQRAAYEVAKESEMCFQCGLLRCIFANPFRDVPGIDRGWLTWKDGTVWRLAATVYEERFLPDGTLDNACLAILADALEEAGCDNADILNHCRQPGEHVRGCWVVDLLLGKS